MRARPLGGGRVALRPAVEVFEIPEPPGDFALLLEGPCGAGDLSRWLLDLADAFRRIGLRMRSERESAGIWLLAAAGRELKIFYAKVK